jgi:hypothetical protein
MAIKFLNNLDVQGTLDLNDNQLLNIVVQKLATDPTVVEGQIYYNTTSDILKYATSSAWVALSSATGDITGVSAGTGLSGGGSSGSVTVSLSSATIAEIDANTLKNSYPSADATKLSGIATNANNFSLPTAAASTLGGIKVGTNLSINGSGVLSATDTNTEYSVGDGGLTQKNFTTTLKSKLDGITAGADVTNATTVVAALTAGSNISIAANGTISSTDTNTQYSVGNGGLSEINFTSAKNTKLDGISTSADVTDATTVAAAGALMDSEMTDLAGVKAVTISTLAPKASPALTGNPTAPTQTAGNSSTRVATTAFVTTAVSNLIGGAPAALDTLNELAAAIGDDASYASGITTALAGKSPTAGNTSLVTVGTITTGTWNGTAINQTYLVGQSGTNTGDEPDANTTTKGIAERATTTEAKNGSDTTRFVTPEGLGARCYSEAIGGATSVTVTHNLGTRNVIVQMYDTSSFETVYADVTRTSTSAITVDFASAPSAGDVTCLVQLIN